MHYAHIHKKLLGLGDKEQAAVQQRFFKTGPGQYGEGDRFLGINVPVLRSLAREHENISRDILGQLLTSPLHEERMLALLIMIRRFEKGSAAEKDTIYEMYLASTGTINNWDLVDVSAPHIVGAYLADKKTTVLKKLIVSPSLWERRIALLATFYCIRRNRFRETCSLCRMVLDDSEDLIHKAAGWMLREIGKRSPVTEEEFLQKHYRSMPRTMLRYAIERFPEKKRKQYLAGEI